MADLLIEILSEEIPARMQSAAIANFERMMTDALVENGLSYGSKQSFVTPRRMALMLSDVPAQSLAQTEERKGPRTDAPEKAIEGFLRSTGLTIDALQIRADKKGDAYFAKITTPGRAAAEIISDALTQTMTNFPWPKSMRWGSTSLRWVRPITSILAIMSENDETQIIDFELEGIRAGNETRGHRFLAPATISVRDAEDYVDALRQAYVILDDSERKEMIRNDAKTAAFAKGLELIEDEALLAQNAGLVEYPVVYTGEIEDSFMELPPEVLRTSMAEHQKFLSLKNAQGQVAGYVIVANRKTEDDGATIKAGNAKVLRARLADAVFFWENDLRTVKSNGFDDWLNALGNVTFHNKLGTQRERIARIEALAGDLAPVVKADSEQTKRAAQIAKADLASEMVYEFPELQGIMGSYYAQARDEAREVAAACQGHYAPLGPSDDVPTEPVSIAVALADKIDMLTGFWAIDEKPSGSKDPFALRRAALGVIRILDENHLGMALLPWLEAGFAQHGVDQTRRQELSADLGAFLINRLSIYLRDQGLRHDVISAGLVAFLSEHNGIVDLTIRRIEALNSILTTPEGRDLQAGIKRALSILGKEEAKDGVSYELDPEPSLFASGSERALYDALARAASEMETALAQNAFQGAMEALANARGEVDTFFEKTVVNDENATIRRNRLCLLNQIRVLSRQIGDFNLLEG